MLTKQQDWNLPEACLESLSLLLHVPNSPHILDMHKAAELGCKYMRLGAPR